MSSTTFILIMSSLPYLNLAGYVTKCAVILTLCTNSLLIHLTYYHVMNITLAYKCLICIMALLGISLNMIETIVHPYMHSYNASFIYFSTSLASRDHRLGVALLTVYGLNYVLIICILAIQFIYRACVVLSPSSLKWFHGWNIFIWFSYCVVFVIGNIASLTELLPDQYSKRYLSEEMSLNYDSDVDFIPSYQYVVYSQNGTIRYHNMMGVLGLSSVESFHYTVMIYCGIKIHYGLKAMGTQTSPKIYRLQRQLFNTLLLQITIPSIFYNSPALLLYIIPYFDWKISFPSGLMVCFFSLYPALDSLILMFMVADYYRVVRNKFLKMLNNLSEWAKRVSEEDSEAEAETEAAGEELQQR